MLASEWNRMIVALGLSVRDLRTVLGWSQCALAERAITSQGSVSRLESGTHPEIPFRSVVLVLRALALGAHVANLPLSFPARSLLTFLQGFEVGITPAVDPGLAALAQAYQRLSAPGRDALLHLIESIVAFREVA